MLRAGPFLAVALLLVPVLCGMLATILPALGYLPILGGYSISLDTIRQLFGQPGIWKSIGLSLAAGLATTAIALTTVMMLVAGWYGSRAFARLQYLISPLLSVPHAATAFGLAFLIAPSGFVVRLISPWSNGVTRPPDVFILNDPLGLSMMAGLIIKEFPFLLLVTLAALPQTPARRSRQVAQGFGYGASAGFLLTVWPLVYRQIRLAVFAVIAYAASVVDVAIILGPVAPPTLAVRMTQWMADPDISMRLLASAGALVQFGVVMLALAVWWTGERIAGWSVRRLAGRGWRFRRDIVPRVSFLALAGFFSLVVFAGLGILALWSLSGLWSFPDALPRSFSTENWRRALPALRTPLFNTMVAGLAATIIAITLALLCLEREARVGNRSARHREGSKALLFIYLPLIVPQVSFVFGLQILFVWSGLDASWPALVLVHLVFVFPYVVLSLSDPWRAWDNRYTAVAQGLGAGRNRIFWHIRLPMLAKPVLTAAAVGFAVSVGQYLPTLLIGAGRLPTVTTEAVSLASGGNRRVIGVYAFLQMLLPFFVFLFAALVPALLFRNRRDMRQAS